MQFTLKDGISGNHRPNDLNVLKMVVYHLNFRPIFRGMCADVPYLPFFKLKAFSKCYFYSFLLEYCISATLFGSVPLLSAHTSKYGAKV